MIVIMKEEMFESQVMENKQRVKMEANNGGCDSSRSISSRSDEDDENGIILQLIQDGAVWI